ncbi:MAG: hypothetical protein MUE42_07215 [Opitutaceae bacterium]|jgi:hypothetical protein|nr:hypothetical protein [Opitutaceae bacterium]
MLASPILAAAKLTVWEKLQAVPRETWLSLLLTMFVIWLIVRVWKSLQEVNEIVPWVALLTLGTTVVLYWTYERTEPKLLSPIFNQLAKVLPTRIEYKEFSPPR